jgi:aminoglycoside phosphotransferase (APT) family kinase protein
VLGVPFLVMTERPGVVVKGQWPAGPAGPRSAACAGLVAALAEVHRVPWRDTPLREFARPEPYATRQLRRLSRQWTLAAGGSDTLAHEVHTGLIERFAVPPSRADTVLHGDFGLHNVVLAPDGRVTSILDWELWTVGDPLADLAWLLALWAEPGDPPSRLDLLGPLARDAADGAWSRTRLADEYCRRTGTDLTDLPRYLALSYYKLGVIQAGIAHRLRLRTGRDAEAADVHRRARLAIRAALDELGHAA